MQRINRLIFLAAALGLALLFGAAQPAWAAGFQVASVLVDTEANIRAKAGLYTHQRAHATDQNGAQMFWNGSAWLWATHCQSIARIRTDQTAPIDTNDNALMTVASLPKLGTEDALRISALFTVTNNASITLSAKVGSVGSMASGFSLSMASNGAILNLVTEMRNRSNAASQAWFSNNKAVFGATSGSVSTTTKDFSTAGKVLTLNALKVTGSDSAVLNWADVSVCGAGVP